MYDHLGLRVKDLAVSRRFYEAVLAPLGYGICMQDDHGVGFGPPGEPALCLHAQAQPAGSGVHVAFRANDRAVVDRFHRAGLAAGGRDNGAPGLRLDYGPHYYAAFLVDPDGNNVEAVCLRAAS